MLNALIDGENRQVSGTGQAPVVKHRSQIAKHLRTAICRNHNPVDKIGAWQVQHFFGNRSALMGKQGLGFVAEDSLDVSDHIASPWRVAHSTLIQTELITTSLLGE